MRSGKHRQSIRQMTAKTSNNRISPQWKDALKQKCLERAREKRDQRIALNRKYSPTQSMVCSEFESHGNGRGIENDSNDECTRSMIQNQLEATGVTVISSSQNDDDMDDVNFCTPVRGTFIDDSIEMYRPNLFPDIGIHDGTYITEEELFSLMNEIEEEIQREEEQYLAEQMESLQHEETMNELLFVEQIESFENLHIDNDDSIPCPICHAGLLALDERKTPCCGPSMRMTTTSSNSSSKTGIIYCQRRNQNHSLSSTCTLSRGAYFGDEMTLERLKETLINAYEQHSNCCRGELKFDFLESHDQSGLVVTCPQCTMRNILIPTSPIQR